MAGARHAYGLDDVQPGDWIKYRSGYYGSGRLAEVHAVDTDVHSGPYAVTTEGNVLFDRIIRNSTSSAQCRRDSTPVSSAPTSRADQDDAAAVRLPTTPPFHLEATVRVLQRRPGGHEVWEGNRYLRVFTTPDGLVLTAVENRGTIDAPDVRLSILAGAPSATTRHSVAETLGKMLAVRLDPAPLHAAAMRLRSLRPTALALRGMRPPRFAALFETFGSVVPFQQLSLDAGAAIVRRLVERFGERLLHAGKSYAAFPQAGAVAGARLPPLLACGLSRSKAESLRSLAKAVEAGEVSEAAIAPLATSAALKELVALPGIGPWSAALVLLRGFGRLEVFPPGDSGAIRGLTALLHSRSPESLARVIQRFGDYRGYLYLCGLGASLLAKGLIHGAATTRNGPTTTRAGSARG